MYQIVANLCIILLKRLMMVNVNFVVSVQVLIFRLQERCQTVASLCVVLPKHLMMIIVRFVLIILSSYLGYRRVVKQWPAYASVYPNIRLGCSVTEEVLCSQ